MKKRIYIIKCDKFCKIGISSTPDDRLLNLQVGNPVKLTLFKSLEIPKGMDASIMESECHKELSQYHERGEWFRRAPLECLRACERVLKLSQLEIARRTSDDKRMFNGQSGKHISSMLNRNKSIIKANAIRDSNEQMITIDKETIELVMSSRFGIKKSSLEALGEPWPPQRGWKKRIMGKSIPKEIFSRITGAS